MNAIRGQAKQLQAEFDAPSRQVETVALSVSLRTDVEAQVFGLNWRPLYQLKLAARQGLEAVGVYAGVMVSILFYAPAVVLWLATTLIVVAAAWRIFMRLRKTLFATKPA